MRFMVMVQGAEDLPAPSEEVFAEMARYNEELVKAGVMLAGEGLMPSSDGALVRFRDGVPTVIDGPFAEGKEVIGGFWILEVKSREEAIEWIKRVPADPSVPGRIEIRQIVTVDDFGDAATPELRARQDAMEAELKQRR
ncbi:dehydrogenase [Actinophytocola xinjiangensis]|uniref:Dehydrogenase n=1 Tax=Actinophytocola xinjiangensis TaxID=485602 RepID=A0A7Z1B1A5_9PSEU|nr:YciI family protein [Actinophytocola xinjiangensis]OLF14485.1 dehydrogenase [Actinophytocola xinjiangensis]